MNFVQVPLKNKKNSKRSQAGCLWEHKPTPPAPPPTERRPLLSGCDGRRSFVRLRQTKGRAWRGHAGRQRGRGRVNGRVRSASSGTFCPTRSLCFPCWGPSIPEANPAARLRVSLANTYSVVTVHVAFPPLPRPSSRKAGAREGGRLRRLLVTACLSR